MTGEDKPPPKIIPTICPPMYAYGYGHMTIEMLAPHAPVFMDVFAFNRYPGDKPEKKINRGGEK